MHMELRRNENRVKSRPKVTVRNVGADEIPLPRFDRLR